MRDTVGDIDILVEAEAGAGIIAQFLRFPDIAEALSKGPVRASDCSVPVRTHASSIAAYVPARQQLPPQAHN